MPTYEYRCPDCRQLFTLRRAVKDYATGKCPDCDRIGILQYHVVPVHYHGTGFYTTDYCNRKP